MSNFLKFRYQMSPATYYEYILLLLLHFVWQYYLHLFERDLLHRIAYFKSNRFLILLLQAEKEKGFLLKNCMFKL